MRDNRHFRQVICGAAAFGAVVFGLLGLAACQGAVSLPGATTPTPETEIALSGYLEATEVNVAPEIGAQILELGLEEGDRVRAGQVVARLDDLLLRAQRQQAEAALLAAQAALTETRAGPRPETVEAAEADVQRAQAEQQPRRRAHDTVSGMGASPFRAEL